MISPVQLTVGIPTYNRASQLAILLGKITAQSLSDEVEILVSDNASLDSTLHVAESFRLLLGDRLVVTGNERNLGFDGNVWSLYRKARGRYIWFLSDDDDFVPGSIAKILAVIKREQNFGLIALPGVNLEPYFAHAEAHAVHLLPWRPRERQSQSYQENVKNYPATNGSGWGLSLQPRRCRTASFDAVRRLLRRTEEGPSCTAGSRTSTYFINRTTTSCLNLQFSRDHGPGLRSGSWNLRSSAFVNSTAARGWLSAGKRLISSLWKPACLASACFLPTFRNEAPCPSISHVPDAALPIN